MIYRELSYQTTEWNFYQLTNVKDVYDWNFNGDNYRISEHANSMYSVYQNGSVLEWFKTIKQAVSFLSDKGVPVTYRSPYSQKPVGIRTDTSVFEVTDTNHNTFLCNLVHLSLYDLQNISHIRRYWNNEFKIISKSDVKEMILDRYKGIMAKVN